MADFTRLTSALATAFSYELVPGSTTWGALSIETVFALLRQTLEKNGLGFEYQDYGAMGVLVKKIGNQENSTQAGKYWQYWVNGKFSTVGSSGYKVKPGDVIEWRYAEEQY